MAIYVPNKETISKIIRYVTDAESILSKVSIHCSNSLCNIPSQIKSNISGDYSDLNTDLTKLQKDCEYVIDGINMCANSYMEEYSEEEKNLTGFAFENNDFNLISSGALIQADKEFFVGLANNRKGTYDDETGIYSITSDDIKYEYNVSTGKFWINGKKSEVVFGIYAPENISNYRSMNTITFLHGDDNGRGIYEFDSDKDIVKWSITEDVSNNNVPPDTIMIFPQANTKKESGNGFYPYSKDVVAGTEFVKAILDQDSKKTQNGLVCFSSGVKSGFKIASTDGKDTYDAVVGINGYAGYSGKTMLTESDAKVLNSKNVTIWSSTNDANDQLENGEVWQNRTKSLAHMQEIGMDATFHTNNQGYKAKLESNGFTKIDFMNNNPKFDGHVFGCKTAIKELNALHCIKQDGVI